MTASICVQQPQLNIVPLGPVQATTTEQATPTPLKTYAEEMGGEALVKIIEKESADFTVTGEHYPSGYTPSGVKSSAYGLGGFLDSTWDAVGCVKSDDPYYQVDCTMKYVEKRYGSPEVAWAFHREHNYY